MSTSISGLVDVLGAFPSGDAARPRDTDPPLVGTLRRSYDVAGAVGAACLLVTDDGRAFHLNTFEGSETDWTGLSERSLRELARFEAQLVRVTYSRLEESVFGPSLWGVRVEAVV